MDKLIEERYYGQLPEFIEMEKNLQGIIDKIKKDPKHCNPNTYKENAKLSSLMKKVFGVKRVIFYWEPYNVENAYTIPCNVLLLIGDSGKHIVKRQDSGFYDDSHKMILTIYLYPGLITMADLTARELLATILHETGHNFDKSGYHMMSLVIDSFLSLGLALLGTLPFKNKENKIKLDYYNKTKKEDDKLFDDNKKRDKLNKDLLNRYKNYYKRIKWSTILTTPLYIAAIPLFAVLSPFIQLPDLARKNGEIFSDSFATAYGYGEDLIRALEKFDNSDKYYKPKTKLQEFMTDLGKFQSEVYVAFFDCHGTNQERCKHILHKLKKDLKKNDFPPELREELVNEINRITRQHKRLRKFDENERFKLTKVWRKVSHFLFGGIPGISKLLPRHQV